MRQPLILVRAGLAVAAALAVLTACSGNNGNSASSTTTPTTTAATTTTSTPTGGGGTAPAAFCQQVGPILQQLQTLPAQVANPQAIAQSLQQIVPQLGNIQPPAAIQSDWQQLTQTLQQLAQKAQSTDFTNQQQASAFQQQLGQAAGPLTTAATKIGQYVTQNCGTGATATTS